MKWTRRDEIMGWNVIQGSDGKLPEHKKVVVGLWVQMEMVSQLCYYDYKVAEWYDANPGQESEVIFAPDYWIELPD